MKTLEVTFDGEVFRPDESPGLEPNRRYLITVQEPQRIEDAGDVWDTLDKLAGTIDAPEDWSEQHDHYLYGTPKRNPVESA